VSLGSGRDGPNGGYGFGGLPLRGKGPPIWRGVSDELRWEDIYGYSVRTDHGWRALDTLDVRHFTPLFLSTSTLTLDRDLRIGFPTPLNETYSPYLLDSTLQIERSPFPGIFIHKATLTHTYSIIPTDHVSQIELVLARPLDLPLPRSLLPFPGSRSCLDFARKGRDWNVDACEESG
jgi:hypothetical protein